MTGLSLSNENEKILTTTFLENFDPFAWITINMFGIELHVMFHNLLVYK